MGLHCDYSLLLARMTWSTFEGLFLDKYFLKVLRDAIQAEFFALQQGNMTITEYETKLSALAFVP